MSGNRKFSWALSIAGFALAACAKPVTDENCILSNSSGISELKQVAGTQGAAEVFFPDPVAASGNSSLSPTSLRLDLYRQPVELERLSGKGILEGQYVEVRNGISCSGGFLAFDEGNRFVYSHSDPRFQEAMAYYVGDRFRSSVANLGYLTVTDPVQIVAHCMKQDNAYFAREIDAMSGKTIQKVCLGDSLATPGASYGDDAVVTIHELQHATTHELYTGSTPNLILNQFWYDEAGALNEAISDFAGLVTLESHVPAGIDARQFSRWALDKFYPNQRATRGAHRCPEYDSGYRSGCASFGTFSSDSNLVSYVYPDGLGWPYADNFAGPDEVRSAFKNTRSQEEIHNAGILLSGALWDMYDALKARRSGDGESARALSLKAVYEALRQLPRPSLANLSPVSFRSLASAILSVAPSVGFSAGDVDAARQAFSDRGLVGGAELAAGWAAVGEGLAVTPGLKVEDNPNKLRSWLYSLGSDPGLVTHGIETGMNAQLDPGEIAAIWFDLKNVSAVTAGGVQLRIVSQDPEVTFLDGMTNIGAVSSSEAQIQYFKINGTAIVQALNGPNFPTGAGNSYFGTNPYFSRTWSTALWVKVSPSAAHGRTVSFRVEATPSNGAAATATFTARIN